MELEIGKYYMTRDGHKARVLCLNRTGHAYPAVVLVTSNTNKVNNQPVEEIKYYCIDGTYSANSTSVLDLVALWSEFKPGQPVWVKNTEHTPEYLRIFKGITSKDYFIVADGCMTDVVKYCRAVTVEDLK